ncbi:hypothetical protein [Sphingorhabdus contaminans]|uniref:hypothetical protein n=1 Tax=Sphingorhabdus contaminans TaxID=1343899 RepID=UPI001476C53D|nr:hypothetical protein [Sphingorhabdus contaminans]
MQFRLPASLIIFAGSYLPLSVILLAQDFDYSAIDRRLCFPGQLENCILPLSNPTFAIGIFVVTLVCFIATLSLLKLVVPKHDVEITEAEYVPADLINYTLPYIVSFMSIDYQDSGKLVGLCVFLGWMFWITHKSGQIILNPVLIALNWRPYNISFHYVGAPQIRQTLALVNGELELGPHKLWPVQSIQIIKPAGPSDADS